MYIKRLCDFDSKKLKGDLSKIKWINAILKKGNNINKIFNIFTKILVK